MVGCVSRPSFRAVTSRHTFDRLHNTLQVPAPAPLVCWLYLSGHILTAGLHVRPKCTDRVKFGAS